eukprot:7391549-Prymnesium_polylepis.1
MQLAQPPLELRVGELVLLRIALRIVGIDALAWHEQLQAPSSAHRLGAELGGDEVCRPEIGRHARRLAWVPVVRVVVRGRAAVIRDVGVPHKLGRVPIVPPAVRVLVHRADSGTVERHGWRWQGRRFRWWWRLRRRRRRRRRRFRRRRRSGRSGDGFLRRVEVERHGLLQVCRWVCAALLELLELLSNCAGRDHLGDDPLANVASLESYKQRQATRARHNAAGRLLAIQPVAEPLHDLVRLHLVVPTLLPHVVNGLLAVHEELLD